MVTTSPPLVLVLVVLVLLALVALVEMEGVYPVSTAVRVGEALPRPSPRTTTCSGAPGESADTCRQGRALRGGRAYAGGRGPHPEALELEASPSDSTRLEGGEARRKRGPRVMPKAPPPTPPPPPLLLLLLLLLNSGAGARG